MTFALDWVLNNQVTNQSVSPRASTSPRLIHRVQVTAVAINVGRTIPCLPFWLSMWNFSQSEGCCTGTLSTGEIENSEQQDCAESTHLHSLCTEPYQAIPFTAPLSPLALKSYGYPTPSCKKKMLQKLRRLLIRILLSVLTRVHDSSE